jgi:ABC-type polysaccharide/polyol phosphate transport system ATPase subunit
MDLPAISLKGISKSYVLYDKPIHRLLEALHPLRKKYSHEFQALKDINFTFPRGKTLGVIGSNGSGKSTLLKILSGVLTPTFGTVEVHGKISALLELGAGFNPELTGIENIYFSGALLNISRVDMAKKIPEICEFAGIGEFVHQQVKLYSSGMFARLAFAVAISVSPDILIVDEALSVGDAAFSLKCLNKMNEIAKAGATIIFVSHDIQSVKTFCDQVLWINKGQVQMFGDPYSTCSAYLEFMFAGTIRDLKVGTPEQNSINRWGTGEVRILDYKFTSNTSSSFVFNYGCEFQIDITTVSSVPNRSGRIGFSIRTEKALDLVTWMSDEVNFANEQVYRTSVALKNILAPGRYFLILVVDNLPNGSYYDYIENAFQFEVISERAIYSLVLPDIKVISQK